jgi:molybdenum cofactor biosynthesis enzyme MoaA
MIDAELARLMQAAGFKTIRLSLESVRQERLEDWDNKVTFEDLLRAVWNLRQAGFGAGQMGAYVMTGLPGETVEEAVRSTAAVHAAGIPVRLAHYSPIPGTRYFELAKKEARFDISEPLLQNNTVVPAGAIGSYSEYAVLKDFANRLNEALAGNRTVFTGAQVEKEDPRKLLEAVMKA